MKNLTAAGMDDFPESAGSGLAAYVAAMFDPALAWKDLDWLSGITRLPVAVKGVVRPDDAVRAAENGAAAIFVSNHGGRQLDTSPPTIAALPGIVEAAGGRIEILLDGGIRRGTDVLKALALGANGVAVGRPVIWGLAVDGEAGVCRVLEMLREELDLAMGLCGCGNLMDITPDLIFRPAGGRMTDDR